MCLFFCLLRWSSFVVFLLELLFISSMVCCCFVYEVSCEGKSPLGLDPAPAVTVIVGFTEHVVFACFVLVPVFCVLFVLFVIWVCTVVRLLFHFFPGWLLNDPCLLLRVIMGRFSEGFFVFVTRFVGSIFGLFLGFILFMFLSSVAGLSQISSLGEEKVLPSIPITPPINIDEVVPSSIYDFDFFWEWLIGFIKAKLWPSNTVNEPVVEEDVYIAPKIFFNTPSPTELRSEIEYLKIPEAEIGVSAVPFWEYCWVWVRSWFEKEKPLYNSVDISEASGGKFGVVRPTKSDLSGIGIGDFAPELLPRVVDANGTSLVPRMLPLGIYGLLAEDPLSHYIKPWVSYRFLSYYFSIKSAVQGIFGLTHGYIYKDTGFTPKENLLLANWFHKVDESEYERLVPMREVNGYLRAHRWREALTIEERREILLIGKAAPDISLMDRITAPKEPMPAAREFRIFTTLYTRAGLDEATAQQLATDELFVKSCEKYLAKAEAASDLTSAERARFIAILSFDLRDAVSVFDFHRGLVDLRGYPLLLNRFHELDQQIDIAKNVVEGLRRNIDWECLNPRELVRIGILSDFVEACDKYNSLRLFEGLRRYVDWGRVTPSGLVRIGILSNFVEACDKYDSLRFELFELTCPWVGFEELTLRCTRGEIDPRSYLPDIKYDEMQWREQDHEWIFNECRLSEKSLLPGKPFSLAPRGPRSVK